MKILMEETQIIKLLSNSSLLQNIFMDLSNELPNINKDLIVKSITNDNIRIYYETKSICSIKVTYNNKATYIIEDYKGQTTISDEKSLMSNILTVIKNLNY